MLIVVYPDWVHHFCDQEEEICHWWWGGCWWFWWQWRGIVTRITPPDKHFNWSLHKDFFLFKYNVNHINDVLFNVCELVNFQNSRACINMCRFTCTCIDISVFRVSWVFRREKEREREFAECFQLCFHIVFLCINVFVCLLTMYL